MLNVEYLLSLMWMSRSYKILLCFDRRHSWHVMRRTSFEQFRLFSKTTRLIDGRHFVLFFFTGLLPQIYVRNLFQNNEYSKSCDSAYF